MQLLNKIFKHDSYAFGALLGLVSPVAFLFMLYYGFILIGGLFNFQPFPIETLYLLSIIINLLYLRMYLVTYKFEKTGKSVIIVTFLLVILFFIFKP